MGLQRVGYNLAPEQQQDTLRRMPFFKVNEILITLPIFMNIRTEPFAKNLKL